jgi:hypothetical protein
MEYRYEYSKEPSGNYDNPHYHCVTKYVEGKFEWCFSYPSEMAAKDFMRRNQGKDIPYPGKTGDER